MRRPVSASSTLHLTPATMTVQLAALCCFCLAYLTAAERLAGHSGYGYEQPTTAHPSPVYYVPAQGQAALPTYQAPQVQEKPMPFGYGYGVSDLYNGIDFGHNTNSDGKVTTGEYRVLLPDGRTQIVTYAVDDFKGYQAKVSYEGEAKPYVAPQTNQHSSQKHQPHSGYKAQQTHEHRSQQHQPHSGYKAQQTHEHRSQQHQPQLEYETQQKHNNIHQQHLSSLSLPHLGYETQETHQHRSQQHQPQAGYETHLPHQRRSQQHFSSHVLPQSGYDTQQHHHITPKFSVTGEQLGYEHLKTSYAEAKPANNEHKVTPPDTLYRANF